jgi:hypothetical protein
LELVTHLDDAIVKEAEALTARRRALRLEKPFQLEQLHCRLHTSDLLVDLGTGRARAKVKATTMLFHRESPC